MPPAAGRPADHHAQSSKTAPKTPQRSHHAGSSKTPASAPRGRGDPHHHQHSVKSSPLTLGSQVEVSSTVISTFTNGRKRQAKLEDLETNALEEYSGEVVELSRKKKITMRNAFDMKLIDCTHELLKRSSTSQTSNGERGNTDEIKMFAARLETCGRIYALRVDNTHMYANDLNEDLERVAAGKKTRQRKEDEATGGAERENGHDEERGSNDGDFLDDNETPATSKGQNRGHRKMHVVDSAELACSETDINANLISRYWTLIGNVQPGVMKDSWVHDAERVESASSVNFVMNPDLTCIQRYENMLRRSAASKRTCDSQLHCQDGKVLSQAQASLLDYVTKLEISSEPRRISVDDCVTFAKSQEKLLLKTAKSVAKKQPRYRLKEDMESERSRRERLEKVCRAIAVTEKDCLREPAENEMFCAQFAQQIFAPDDYSGAGSIDFDEVGDLPEDPSISDDITDQPENITGQSFRSIRSGSRTGDATGSGVSSLEEDVVAVSSIGSVPAIVDDDTTNSARDFVAPRSPSIARSSRPASQPKSVTSNRGSRYGSVMKENIADRAIDGKRSLSVNSIPGTLITSPMKKKQRLDSAWPEQFLFDFEQRGQVYEKIAAKTKGKTTRNMRDSMITGRIEITALLELLSDHNSWRLDSLANTLSLQTKAFMENLKGNWLADVNPNSTVSNDKVCAALRGAFDEDYDADRERLVTQWAQHAEENYSLSSEELSDEDEDFFDATSFEDPVTGERVPLAKVVSENQAPETANASFLSQESIAELPSESVAEVVSDLVAQQNEMLVETIGVDVAVGDVATDDPLADLNWASVIAAPANRDSGLLTAAQLREIVTASSADAFVLNGLSGEMEPDRAIAYAENIALRDCTGSGVNIGRMKRGVLKTYLMLMKWRSQIAHHFPTTSATRDPLSKLPFLTVENVISYVHLKLARHHHRHINPSVVFSCLLHLAYETKLYLCNSEDLLNLYVMMAAEYKAYSDQHPHLNRLNEAYVRTLLNMKMPLAAATTVEDPVTLLTKSISTNQTTAPRGHAAMDDISGSVFSLSLSDMEGEADSESDDGTCSLAPTVNTDSE